MSANNGLYICAYDNVVWVSYWICIHCRKNAEKFVLGTY
jgi:hypothetical protein